MCVFICQPCGLDGHFLEADGFCENCQEYLCGTCFKHHLRPSPMCHHVLLDKKRLMYLNNEQVGRVNDALTNHIKDMCTEHCPSHLGKLIEYYCTSDTQLGCSVSMKHRSCDGVSYIPDISVDMWKSNEYKEMDKTLKRLVIQYDDLKKRSEVSVVKVENDFRQSLRHIKELRKNINTYFDKLESEIVKKVISFKDEEIGRINFVSETCASVSAELVNVISDLENKNKRQQTNQLFVSLKKLTHKVKQFEENLGNIYIESKAKRFKFERANNLNEMIKELPVLGDICLIKDPEDKEVVNDESLSVTTESDTLDSRITGIANLHDGRVVIADNGNKCIKIIDVKQNSVESQLSLSSAPFGVTEMSQGEVAVTFPIEMKIQILSVSDTMSNVNEFYVEGQCKGIACHKQRLLVSFVDPGKVELMETDGTVVRRFTTGHFREQLFTYPEHVAISPDLTTIYVSDSYTQKIVALTLEGKIKGCYRDIDLKDPCGLAVDKDGTVYVCGSSSYNLHMISPECAKIKTLFNNNDKIANPSCMLYSEEEDKIYLGTFNKDIKVLQIK